MVGVDARLGRVISYKSLIQEQMDCESLRFGSLVTISTEGLC